MVEEGGGCPPTPSPPSGLEVVRTDPRGYPGPPKLSIFFPVVSPKILAFLTIFVQNVHKITFSAGFGGIFFGLTFLVCQKSVTRTARSPPRCRTLAGLPRAAPHPLGLSARDGFVAAKAGSRGDGTPNHHSPGHAVVYSAAPAAYSALYHSSTVRAGAVLRTPHQSDSKWQHN